MFESEMTVTRKGRVTIPAELRKKYGMREGMKVDITDVPSGPLLKPIPHMNDWAGADAGTYTYEEMVRSWTGSETNGASRMSGHPLQFRPRTGRGFLDAKDNERSEST